MKKVVFLQPQNGGTVAQLVEQRTENPRVTGSIPVGTTTKETQVLRLFFLPWPKKNKGTKKAPPNGKCFLFNSDSLIRRDQQGQNP